MVLIPCLLNSPQTSPFGDRTPNMTRDPRNRLPGTCQNLRPTVSTDAHADLTRYFSEAWDEEGGQKVKSALSYPAIESLA